MQVYLKLLLKQLHSQGYLLVAYILMACGLLWRVFLLNSVPFSFYHDEFDYIFAGQSVATFGTDVTGEWSPWQLRPLQTLNVTAELPAFFHAVFFTFFYDSVLWGRIPATVFGLFTIFLGVYLVWCGTKNKSAAVWAGAFLAISPWHIFISRSGLEASINVFFLALLVVLSYVLVHYQTKKGLTQLNLFKNATLLHYFFLLGGYTATLFFAFFTYHGAKFTSLGISLVTLAFLLRSAKLSKQKLVSVLWIGVSMVAVVLWTVLQIKSGLYGNRQSELIFSSQHVESLVTQKRAASLSYPGLDILRPLLSNEVTIVAFEFIKQYFAAFDFHRLFITGYEGTFQFSLIVHSFFMLSGIVTIPLGWWWLWENHRTFTQWVLAYFIVSPITTAVSVSTQSIFRSSLTYFILVLVSGLGAYALISLLKARRNQFIILLCSTVFISESLWFGAQYFVRYPVVAIENHEFEYRLLSNYLKRLDAYKKSQHSVLEEGTVQINDEVPVVVQRNPWHVARTYVGYTGIQNTLTLEERTAFTNVNDGTLKIGRYQFQLECSDLTSMDVYVLHPALYEECHNEAAELAIRQGNMQLALENKQKMQGQVLGSSIEVPVDKEKILLTGLSSPVDSRTYYWIMNDPLCKDFNLPLFTTVGNFNKYNLETLSDKEFCENWVKKEER